MAAEIKNKKQQLDMKTLKSINDLSEVFIEIGGRFLSADNLFVATKIVDYVAVEARVVEDVKDLIKNKNSLCYREELGGSFSVVIVDPKFYYDGFVVPTELESTSLSVDGLSEDKVVPYGLKRTLSVEGSEPTGDENAYLYVQIGDEWVFVRQGELVWYDGPEQKTYAQAVEEGKDLSTLIFFNLDDKEVSKIYTEYEYKFGKIIKKEVVDLEKNEKSVVTIDDDDVETKIHTEKLDGVISSQKIASMEVADEAKPGKTKKVSKFISTNYSTISPTRVDPTDKSKFISLSFEDTLGSHTEMVKFDDIVDEDGNLIEDLNAKIGKPVYVKIGENKIASQPITYEQANLRYDTIKSYQKVAGGPTEKSCLKFEDGTYVRELASIEPMSYQLASDADFEKYLVRVRGTTKYVIVDKTYFSKSGSARDLVREHAIPIKRCSFNSHNCVIIQTSSTGASMEQAEVIGDITIAGETATKSDKTKSTLYNEFIEDYKKGEYEVNDIYVDEDFKKLDDGGLRYEYTDEIIHDDYADSLRDYKALGVKDLSIKNGKMVGGGSYNVSKGIKESFSVYHNVLIKGFPIAAAAGFFIPVVGPIAASIYGVGLLAAIPGIPIGQAIYGAVKNRSKNYQDKFEYQHKQEVKNLASQVQDLFSKQATLKPEEFEDAYARLMANVYNLAKTTNAGTLIFKDGQAKVDSSNVYLANQYVKEYNDVNKKLEKCNKKIKAYTKKGKPVPVELQQEHDELEDRQKKLKNGIYCKSYTEDENFNKFQNLANHLKFYYKATHLEGEALTEFLSEMGLEESIVSRISFDSTKGLLLDGMPLSADEKDLKKKFKKDDSKIEEWQNLRDLIDLNVSKLNEIEIKEPVKTDIEEVAKALGRLDAICLECFESLEFDIKADSEYKIFEHLTNQQTILIEDVNTIYEEAKRLTTAEAIDAKVSELTAKKEIINILSSDNVRANEIVEKIDTLLTENKEALNIEIKEESEYKIFEHFREEQASLIEAINALNDESKASTNLEELEEKFNELEEKKEDITTLVENNTKAEEIISHLAEAFEEYLEVRDIIPVMEEVPEYKIYEEIKRKSLEIDNIVQDMLIENNNTNSIEVLEGNVDLIREQTEKCGVISEEYSKAAEEIEKNTSLAEELSSLLDRIAGKLSALYGDEKDIFNLEFEELSTKIAEQITGSKNAISIDDIKISNEAMVGSVVEAEDLLNRVDEKLQDLDKELIIARFDEFDMEASSHINSLKDTYVHKHLGSMIEILKKNQKEMHCLKDMASKRGVSPKAALNLRIKALLILELIKVGVAALKVYEEMKNKGESLDKLLQAGAYLADLATVLRVDKHDTVDELKIKVAGAKMKFEAQILPFVQVEEMLEEEPEINAESGFTYIHHETNIFNETIVNEESVIVPPVEEKTPKSKKKDGKKSGVTTERKSSLTIARLDRLLQNIDKLKELDDLYYQADEDIPADIEMKIGKIEDLIRPDSHLLKKAIKNEKYAAYKLRIIRAAKILQEHNTPHTREIGTINI